MGIRALLNNNRFLSRKNNGRVYPERSSSSNTHSHLHVRHCRCKECSRQRKKHCNTALLALCPLLGIIILLTCITG